MTRIRQRRDRHFIDEEGRLYWINGPENHCYLSEQRQWRHGLSFDEVLEWKQCAPSGLVSQRFASLQEVIEAFEHGQIQWFQDLYLRRMGDQMAAHRSADDYKPTAMKLAESRGEARHVQPWLKASSGGPVPAAGTGLPSAVCGQLPRTEAAAGGDPEIAHPHRRRRSAAATAAAQTPTPPGP